MIKELLLHSKQQVAISVCGKKPEYYKKLRNITNILKEIYNSNKTDPSCSPFFVLSLTSNIVSCGLRDLITKFIGLGIVDAVVVTLGGIEEDAIKALSTVKPFLYSFHTNDYELRERGWNRIGNMVMPNSGYCDLETWYQNFLVEYSNKFKCTGYCHMYHEMGKSLIENSILGICSRNNIPVYCPTPTDGALGDNLFFFQTSSSGGSIQMNLMEDIRQFKSSLHDAQKLGRELFLFSLGSGNSKTFCECEKYDRSISVQTGIRGDCGRHSNSIEDENNIIIWNDASLVFPQLLRELFSTIY